MPHFVEQVGMVWANDMDRTLLDTEQATKQLVEVAAATTKLDDAALYEAKLQTELSGGSFDVMGYLVDNGVDADGMKEIYRAFSSYTENPKLLYGDAQPFLDALDEAGIFNVILTYGAPAWQKAKLDASGLSNRPYILTDRKYKGEYIASCMSANKNGYAVSLNSGGIAVASSVILVDDKADSFRGMPEDCLGFWLRRPTEKRLLSQGTEVPEGIVTIESLVELTLDA